MKSHLKMMVLMPIKKKPIMKAMIELPRPEDYMSVSIIDLSNARRQPCLPKDALKWQKGSVNMRSIVDFTQADIEIDVIDEEKYPDFLKKDKAWNEKYGNPIQVQEGQMFSPMPVGDPPPELPIKRMSVKGVVITYFTGIQRVIGMDYEDFKEEYFKYLKFVKLDINQ